MTLSPDGRWLLVANQASDNVQPFAVASDGGLMPLGAPLSLSTPTGIAFI